MQEPIESTKTQHEIDLFYLREAYKKASLYSDDPVAQNGAVIVRDNSTATLDNIVAWGVNRLPRNIQKFKERLEDKETKLLFIGHAERLAMYDALKKLLATERLIMYCPWITCHECATTICEFGLKELIGHTGPDNFYKEINKDKIKTGEKKSIWEKSIEAGFQKLQEAGIPYRFVDGKVGGVKLIFARREFEP